MFCMQDYNHVSLVCRKLRIYFCCRSGECYGNPCSEVHGEPVCIHCSGKHRVGSAVCQEEHRREKMIKSEGIVTCLTLKQSEE